MEDDCGWFFFFTAAASSLECVIIIIIIIIIMAYIHEECRVEGVCSNENKNTIVQYNTRDDTATYYDGNERFDEKKKDDYSFVDQWLW